IYVNGRRAPVNVNNDHLTGTIATTQPLRLGKRSTDLALHAELADVRIYDRKLLEADVRALAFQPLGQALELLANRRTPTQQALLAQVYRTYHATGLIEAKQRAARARKEKADYEKTIPTVMVMEDTKTPRPTYVLTRGQYDAPDKNQKVEPGVPACLPALP